MARRGAAWHGREQGLTKHLYTSKRKSRNQPIKEAEISRSIKRSNNKDTRKFILAMLIYATTITAFDYLTHNLAPAHQNNEKQGQNHQLRGEQQTQEGQLPIPIHPRPDSKQDSEPSRGEAVRGQESIRGQELTLQATAYTWTGNKTATNTWPKQGKTVAVDPATIPFHSRIYIEGLGWRVAEDRIPESSIRKGAKIDVFMDSEADCWEWGRKNVKVVIIPPREDLKNN